MKSLRKLARLYVLAEEGKQTVLFEEPGLTAGALQRQEERGNEWDKNSLTLDTNFLKEIKDNPPVTFKHFLTLWA